MNRSFSFSIVVAVLVSVFAGSAAYAVVLQPDEAASKDVLIYQGMPTFNFETSGPNFQAILASGLTGSGHDLNTLIGFDLAGVPYTAAQVTHATLNLYVRDGTTVGFPFGNPDATHPINLATSAVNSGWTEPGVTWNTQPVVGPPLSAPVVVNGVNGWVSFDVTGQVQAWLAGVPNNGFRVDSQTLALNDAGKKIVAVFNSASAAANRPYLEVVPEPATLGMLVVGAIGFVARRRSRQLTTA